MNKQQLIDAAMQIATGMGTDGHNSPVIDSEMTAEDLLPLVFRHVYTDLLRSNPARMQDLIVEHEIGITDGVGTMPANIITEYIEDSYLPDFPYSSYSQLLDYKRQKFSNLLCYWTEDNGKFLTTCGGAESTEESGSGSEEFDETIKLHAVTIPSLPANATDQIVIAQRDLNQIIYVLAMALRGEIKLVQ